MLSSLRNEYSYVAIAAEGDTLTLRRKWTTVNKIGIAILCFGLLHLYLWLADSQELAFSQLRTGLLVAVGLSLTLLRGVVVIDRRHNSVLTYWSSILNWGRNEFALSDFKTIMVQHVYQKCNKKRSKRFLYPVVLQGPKTIYLHIAISKEAALKTAEEISNFIKIDIEDLSSNEAVEF